MSNLSIVKVNVLPETYVANTIYFVKSATASLTEIYISDSTGTSVRHVANQADAVSAVIHYGETAPAAGTLYKLWWNTAELVLYVKHTDGTNELWVENTPNVAIPDFAGTGTANTMARSDHNHDETYAKIGSNEW